MPVGSVPIISSWTTKQFRVKQRFHDAQSGDKAGFGHNQSFATMREVGDDTNDLLSELILCTFFRPNGYECQTCCHTVKNRYYTLDHFVSMDVMHTLLEQMPLSGSDRSKIAGTPLRDNNHTFELFLIMLPCNTESSPVKQMCSPVQTSLND